MQNQQIPVITADYLMSLHAMLENLTVSVEQIGTKLEKIALTAPVQAPPAPATFKISLVFLAAATRTSKSTIERRIAASKLPKPQVNPDNGYRFWLKSDLPQSLHQQIDARHHETAKGPRLLSMSA